MNESIPTPQTTTLKPKTPQTLPKRLAGLALCLLLAACNGAPVKGTPPEDTKPAAPLEQENPDYTDDANCAEDTAQGGGQSGSVPGTTPITVPTLTGDEFDQFGREQELGDPDTGPGEPNFRAAPTTQPTPVKIPCPKRY
jgi:hypothetical protein